LQCTHSIEVALQITKNLPEFSPLTLLSNLSFQKFSFSNQAKLFNCSKFVCISLEIVNIMYTSKNMRSVRWLPFLLKDFKNEVVVWKIIIKNLCRVPQPHQIPTNQPPRNGLYLCALHQVSGDSVCRDMEISILTCYVIYNVLWY